MDIVLCWTCCVEIFVDNEDLWWHKYTSVKRDSSIRGIIKFCVGQNGATRARQTLLRKVSNSKRNPSNLSRNRSIQGDIGLVSVFRFMEFLSHSSNTSANFWQIGIWLRYELNNEKYAEEQRCSLNNIMVPKCMRISCRRKVDYSKVKNRKCPVLLKKKIVKKFTPFVFLFFEIYWFVGFRGNPMFRGSAHFAC